MFIFFFHCSFFCSYYRTLFSFSPQALSDLTKYHVSDLPQFLNKQNILNNNIGENCRIFPCVKESAMRRRILLGDNRGGGAVMLQPIRFQCVGVWIYIYRERGSVCVCVFDICVPNSDLSRKFRIVCVRSVSEIYPFPKLKDVSKIHGLLRADLSAF